MASGNHETPLYCPEYTSPAPYLLIFPKFSTQDILIPTLSFPSIKF